MSDATSRRASPFPKLTDEGDPGAERPENPERALAALDYARRLARGEEVRETGPLVERADLRALEAAHIREFLDEIIVSRHADRALDGLLVTRVLENLLPEVQAMVGFGDGEWRHKDVWKHTKQVVIQAVPRMEVRYAALFHDIGKVKTRSISPSGEVHFFGHAEVGARMFDKLERRARLFASEDALRDEIRFLVLHHLRASAYEGSWTDSAVRRFAKEMGPHLDALLCLSRADITTKRPEKRQRGVRLIHELGERIEKVLAEDAVVPPLPKGVGEMLVVEFGRKPGKWVGDVKRLLEAACDAGELAPHQTSEYYVDFVVRHRSRFGLEAL